MADDAFSGQSDATVEQNIAAAQAAATLAAAQISANATIQSASTQQATSIEVATINAANNLAVEKLELANRLKLADVTTGASTTQANIQAGATKYGADQSRAAAVTTTAADVEGRIAVANLSTQAQIASANIDAGARVSTAATDAATRSQVAGVEADASKYGADKQLEGVKAREAGEKDRLTLKLNSANDKFQTALGLAQQGLSQVSGSASGLATPGLLSLDTAPAVSIRPVFTPAQISQQINAAIVVNDSRTASQVRDLQGDLAGRGFSSNCPLLDALKVGLAGQNLRANVQAAVTTRLSAAQANADQTTKAQTLALSRWQEQQQVALEAEKNQITRQVGILGAVAQMVNIG